MKNWIRNQLAARGYVIFNTNSPQHYARDSLFTTNSDHFRHDPDFQSAYSRGLQAGQGVDPHIEWRVHVALWAARTALLAEGDFVECGVNAGFVSSAIMHHLDWATRNRPFHLIDTFAGPDLAQFSPAEITTGRADVVRHAISTGGYVTDLARIESNFAEWPTAHIIQGSVPDVLSTLDIPHVAFLHIDMNCVLPEQKALEFFWPRLSSGAIVLFDDYAYYGNHLLTEAIDDTVRRIGANILSLPTGQGLIVK